MRKRLSRVAAIKVKCAECMNFHTDGRVDCEMTTCPLYTFMPYGKKKPNMWWEGIKAKYLAVAYRKAKRED